MGRSRPWHEAVKVMATGGIDNKNKTPLLADRGLSEDELAALVAFLGALECGKLEQPESPKVARHFPKPLGRRCHPPLTLALTLPLTLALTLAPPLSLRHSPRMTDENIRNLGPLAPFAGILGRHQRHRPGPG